jgi:uridine kinase
MTKSRKLPERTTEPLLVAIVGGSGSGKSWLADKLYALLAPHAARLSLDDFYRDRSHLSLARRERLNFDQPRAIDWRALETVLRRLLKGRAARLPCYDFRNHCRLAKAKILEPKPIILVDGLWLLRRPGIRSSFGFKIFLDCGPRIRFQRRLQRDLRSRGRTETSIRKQFRETVEPMHMRYVTPQARFADIILRGQCTSADVQRVGQMLRTGRTISASPLNP